MHILFVCTGNTCRSAMAQALFEKRVPKHGQLVATSAGTSALEGESASYGAQKAMLEYGIDLTGHNAHMLTRDRIQKADLVLAMGQGHLNSVKSIAADSHAYLLMDWALGKQTDVVDPYGGDANVYRQVATQLDQAICAVLRKLDVEPLLDA